MEVTSKHQKTKKRSKKRKAQSEESSETIVKPDKFDGMTNWLKLQKVGFLLAHASQLFLQTLATFLLIPSILYNLVPQAFCYVSKCLSLFHKKVLDTVEKSVPENSARKINFKKTNKKKAYKRHPPNKSGTRATEKKCQFSFGEKSADFFEKEAKKSRFSDEMSDRIVEDNEDGEDKRLTKSIAMDCEMVGVGEDGCDSIVARVSIVNAFGECVYDEYVKPTEEVTDYRTEVSGVRPADLEKGKDLFEVQKEVSRILEGRRVIGHALKHDFDVLFLSHPKKMIRDTSKYKPFREISGGRTPSLKKLAVHFLETNIQMGEHNSVEDAQIAMILYLTHKKQWENSLKKKYIKPRPAK